MAYVTLDDVRTHGDFSASDTVDNGRLEALIPSAQAAIDAWCKTTFEVSSDDTKYFDAVDDTDKLTLYLTGRHGYEWLAAITSITNGDGTTVTSDQYVTEPRNQFPVYAITLKSSSNISWTYTTDSENAIAIEGRWGYSTTVPDSIQLACIMLVLHWYRGEDQVDEKMMPYDIKALLKPYKGLA